MKDKENTTLKQQLTTTSNADINTKNISMASIDDDDDHEKEELPRYLLVDNQLFISLMKKINKINSTIHINDIQEIALIKHRMAVLHIKKQIMETCLQSVTGTLHIVESDLIEVDRRIWPLQVRLLMLKHQQTSTISGSTTTTTMGTDKEDEQVVYENLLQQQLMKLEQSLQEYTRQLQEKQNSIVGFTSKMIKLIDSYVHQYGIQPVKLKSDFKIASIRYNYEFELFERKYRHEQPNEYQVIT